jgi:hypothetical protein
LPGSSKSVYYTPTFADKSLRNVELNPARAAPDPTVSGKAEKEMG